MTGRARLLIGVAFLAVALYAADRVVMALGEAKRIDAEAATLEAETDAARRLLAEAPARLATARTALARLPTAPAWTAERAADVVVAKAEERGVDLKTVLPADGFPAAGATITGTGPEIAAYAAAVEAADGRFVSLTLRARGRTVEATIDVVGPAGPAAPAARGEGTADVAILTARLDSITVAPAEEAAAPAPPPDLARIESLRDPFAVVPAADAVAAAPVPPVEVPFEYVGRVRLDDGREAAVVETPDGVARRVAKGERFAGYRLDEVTGTDLIVSGLDGRRRIPIRPGTATNE